MKKIFIPALFVILVFIISCGGEKYSQYRAYPEPEKLTVVSGTDSFLAVKFEIPEDHYIYGNPKGPGIGKPTRIMVTGPESFRFKPARFLEPEKYIDTDGVSDFTWTYGHETTVFIPFSVKKTDPGVQKVSIKIEVLLCSTTACIPKDETIDYDITIEANGAVKTGHSEDLIELFKDSKVRGSDTEIGTDTSVASSGESQLEAIPFEPQTLDAGIGGLIQAIIFGIIAGFILNFMPCVLPVVSLKVMSFVQHAGEDKKTLRILGMLFSMGILVSFGFLALLAAFFGYNWGGLFQHQLFIVFMAAVILALALSMFDVFTINVPRFAGTAAARKDNPYVDAFLKGLLATLLATPCSGPFLGGTLAWALTQPPMIIIVIFMSIGFGMALPYFILTMNPKLMTKIPKPGQWTVTFERIMGFLLIFTVIYLLGILDSESIMPAILFLGFIALGFWQFGIYGSIVRNLRSRIISFVVLLLISTGGYFLSFHYFYSTDVSHQLSTIEYTGEKLLQNRDRGKATMVIFTADWCPNCKLVESMALHTDTVIDTIRKKNVDVMVADITRKSATANSLLTKLGSRSIPFLAVFPSGDSFKRPICLRDIYSESDVLKAIDMAGEKDH